MHLFRTVIPNPVRISWGDFSSGALLGSFNKIMAGPPQIYWTVLRWGAQVRTADRTSWLDVCLGLRACGLWG